MTFPNPYEEKRKESPGEREVNHGDYFLALLRLLKVDIPVEDVAAVERTGALISRWWFGKIMRRKVK